MLPILLVLLAIAVVAVVVILVRRSHISGTVGVHDDGVASAAVPVPVSDDIFGASSARVMAIVGQTGCGKSVLVRHLLDRYLQGDPARRVLLIDSYAPDHLRIDAWALTRGWSWSVATSLPPIRGATVQPTELAHRLTLVRDPKKMPTFVLHEHDLVVVDESMPDQTSAAVATLRGTPARIVFTAQLARDLDGMGQDEVIWMSGHHGSDEQRTLTTVRGSHADYLAAGRLHRWSIPRASAWWLDGDFRSADRNLIDWLDSLAVGDVRFRAIIERVLETARDPGIQAACFRVLGGIMSQGDRPQLMMAR